MTEYTDPYTHNRRAAGDDTTSNHNNSSQSATSQSQGLTASTSSTSQQQNSTTASQPQSTSQSHSTSKQTSPTSAPAQSPNPSNTTSSDSNNDNSKNSSNQSQNNAAQAQNNATQAQQQSTPSASTNVAANSTSPQPSSVNNAAPNNTSNANPSQSASVSNATATGNVVKPSNSSQIAAPVSSPSNFGPFSTSVTGGKFGNITSGVQENHQSSSKISSGTIAGIAIGGVATLILIILISLFCYRKRKNQKDFNDGDDFEKQKSLHRLSKESLRFKRLSGSSSLVFDTSSRRSSAPRLDIRMHQHHVSMESEEDRAASAGLSGLERFDRRSRSLVDFSDQVHIHREPVIGPNEQQTEDEHMEFFFINEGAPELTNLARRWSTSSIARSYTTSNSLPNTTQEEKDRHHLPQYEEHEEPFDAATNRNSTIHLTEPSKETRNFSRNSILSNLSA